METTTMEEQIKEMQKESIKLEEMTNLLNEIQWVYIVQKVTSYGRETIKVFASQEAAHNYLAEKLNYLEKDLYANIKHQVIKNESGIAVLTDSGLLHSYVINMKMVEK